ncbi:MAG: transcription-repair coupling factor, partial [Ignavibacteriaceae bacterium]|nr:transcription-repair coupling factor [Ignavibacteriaceae bacterium]
MKSELINRIIYSSHFEKVKSSLIQDQRPSKAVFCSPLYGVSKSLLVIDVFETNEQIVLLLPDSKSAEEMNVELNILGLDEYLVLFDEFTADIIQERLTKISRLIKFVLVSTYDLLTLNLPVKEQLEKTTTLIQVGGKIKYDELIEYLNFLNYQREKFVEAPGEFSVRGSIIDFWSYSEHNPVRLEYDGDFLESIRYFDPESQRSIEKTESVSLSGKLEHEGELTSGIFDYLEKPLIIASSFELQNLNPEFERTFSSNKVTEENMKSEKEFDLDDEFPEPNEKEIETPVQPRLNYNDLLKTEGTRWIIEEEISSSQKRIELGFSQAPTINSNYEILFKILMEYSNKNYDIVLTSENELQTARLKDLLSEFKTELAELIDSGRIKLDTLAIKEGFIHHKEKILLLTDYQIFNKPYRTKLSERKKYKKSKSKAFASIKYGDYVVHETYGIGKYAGLKTINIGETQQESMKLLYNEGGVVYVNLNYLNLVKKYSSGENLKPTLSTLGSGEWERRKSKTKKKIKEAARELIELYAKRKATKGFQFSADSIWQKELEASFFYEDTPDQEKVTNEVKQDMEAENPMDRLVCGDVGFGKTEVAVRASFKAVQDGKQVALLVPTTILAEQHYNTFKDRLIQFPVKVAALSRFQTKKEQNVTLKDLEMGNVDVVIGTHRLLSKDIKFKDLGLLMIDEEHRFGVTAKEKLREFKINVDTLALTATPIPRTLNLSLLGARDLSIIATPPPNRQPIYTTVSTFDITRIREWIYTELKRNGQIYFVHDRVESIVKLAGYLNKHIPDVRIGIAHGQMKASQLEEVIHGFLSKKYDVLLSTKIIESGIDIPNVNTIIINRADRFGLAELHQLRGRVGRSTRQAYAYFIVPTLSGLSKKAMRRLQAIEEYTEIGSGFNLSMRDLEIRGAGNLLGKEQTGFINEIGFDLYIKLIDEAVDELKYQEFKEIFKSLPQKEDRTEPTIDAYFEIGIPETYMPEQMDRLNFYTALYAIKNLEELEELKEEMQDRFGPIPSLVRRLLLVATLRYYASYALFERIIMQRKTVNILLPKGEKEDYYKFKFVELMRFILDQHKETVKFDQKSDLMKLVIKNNFDSPEALLGFLILFSMNVSKLFVPQNTET